MDNIYEAMKLAVEYQNSAQWQHGWIVMWVSIVYIAAVIISSVVRVIKHNPISIGDLVAKMSVGIGLWQAASNVAAGVYLLVFILILAMLIRVYYSLFTTYGVIRRIIVLVLLTTAIVSMLLFSFTKVDFFWMLLYAALAVLFVAIVISPKWWATFIVLLALVVWQFIFYNGLAMQIKLSLPWAGLFFFGL